MRYSLDVESATKSKSFIPAAARINIAATQEGRFLFINWYFAPLIINHAIIHFYRSLSNYRSLSKSVSWIKLSTLQRLLHINLFISTWLVGWLFIFVFHSVPSTKAIMYGPIVLRLIYVDTEGISTKVNLQ